MADGTKHVFTPIADLSMKIDHLRALTLSITGEGFDNFKLMNDTNQLNLLWLVDQLAVEISDLFDKMINEKAEKRRQGCATTEGDAR